MDTVHRHVGFRRVSGVSRLAGLVLGLGLDENFMQIHLEVFTQSS